MIKSQEYPIFLLPQGEIMMTAKIEDEGIVLLKETLFPSSKRYAISNNGLAACLDTSKKLILYGQLTESGEFEFVKILPFPSMISPKSICIVNQNLILGGENDHDFSNDINSHELVVSYSIKDDKFIPVEMPFKAHDKCIDDLLLDGDIVIAVDNIVYPKYLLEYDFKNPNSPILLDSSSLPQNGPYETIRKGTRNESFMALESTSFCMDGAGSFINIFKHGDFKKYIRLAQWHEIFESDKKEVKKYYWSDIVLVPDKNLLLISSNTDGIGIYKIKEELLQEDENENDDTNSVIYFNEWNKKVIKILLLPNDPERIIIIFKGVVNDRPYYTYSIESIALNSKIMGQIDL